MASRTLSKRCIQITATSAFARSFIALGPREYHTPPLDFLLPQTASQWKSHTLPSPAPLTLPTRQIKRPFSSSSVRNATLAVHNPQKDEDGKDMAINITARASNRLKQIMHKDVNPHLALRIQVESGGCHGFQYLMSLTTLPSDLTSTIQIQESSASPNASSADKTSSAVPNTLSSGEQEKETEEKGQIGEEDTVFMADDGSEAKVVMDTASLELLKGSNVDFTNELIGSQFKVDNPMATSSCGCGTSFDIKM